MEAVVKSFRDFVEREQLFALGDKLLLACSGGLDSTVLAHLLHTEGYDFAIAHMNFQLRGEASDGDAAFVEDLARTLGAKYHYQAVEVKAQAQPGESTQMTARRLRYDWFEELLSAQQYNYLLTGHHANDHLETFLINLLRGTGVRGLASMAPKRGRFCRPLLTVSRVKLTEYAQSLGLTWREDASNDTDDYLRNRIRHQIVPILSDDFDYPVERWVSTAEHLRSDLFLRDHGLQKLEEAYVSSVNDATVIHRSKVESPQVFQALLYEVGKRFNFSPEQIRQMETAKGNKVFESISDRVYVGPTEIRFTSLRNLQDKPLEAITIQQLPFLGQHGNGQTLRFALTIKPKSLDQPNTLFLAPPTLPLHLRPRQKGDRIRPLGLGGKSKKVKEYMIDQKIPVWLRDQLYLLVNEQDEIMAIPGYCVSEQFKVLPEHDEVLRISWVEES